MNRTARETCNLVGDGLLTASLWLIVLTMDITLARWRHPATVIHSNHIINAMAASIFAVMIWSSIRRKEVVRG